MCVDPWSAYTAYCTCVPFTSFAPCLLTCFVPFGFSPLSLFCACAGPPLFKPKKELTRTYVHRSTSSNVLASFPTPSPSLRAVVQCSLCFRVDSSLPPESSLLFSLQVPLLTFSCCVPVSSLLASSAAFVSPRDLCASTFPRPSHRATRDLLWLRLPPLCCFPSFKFLIRHPPQVSWRLSAIPKRGTQTSVKPIAPSRTSRTPLCAALWSFAAFVRQLCSVCVFFSVAPSTYSATRVLVPHSRIRLRDRAGRLLFVLSSQTRKGGPRLLYRGCACAPSSFARLTLSVSSKVPSGV